MFPVIIFRLDRNFSVSPVSEFITTVMRDLKFRRPYVVIKHFPDASPFKSGS